MTSEEEFFEFANPHAWLLSAVDLRDQGDRIYSSRSTEDQLTKMDAEGRKLHVLNRSDRATYLLWGFAAENLLKAVHICLDPKLVSGGQLAKGLKTHRLDELSSVSDQIVDQKTRYQPMLLLLQNAIISWAKYPCGLNLAQCSEVRPISKEFAFDFCEFFDAHASWLRQRLAKGINLPSGKEYGRFVMSDGFLK